MPKNGIEPIFKSYKEFVLPVKLFRLIIIKKEYSYLTVGKRGWGGWGICGKIVWG